LVTNGLDAAERWLAEHEEEISELSDSIGRFAEPGLAEHRSAEALTAFLERHGFEVTRGVAGMPTAFIAEYGSGGPVIATMCEYDATPGDSQRPVPTPAPISAGAGGFPDLHNGIGTAAAAAAAAAAAGLAENGRPGRIRVLGTPAEKLCIGKPVMAAHGLLDEIDAMIAWHPRPYSTVELDTGPGCYQAQIFDFSGVSAYASAPWVGVSAVDAMTMMNVIVQFMREHVPRQYMASVNEIFTAGGQHPTTLPTHAQAWYVSRSFDLDGIEHLSDMLDRAARAACLATGAGFTTRKIAATRPWLPNEIMARHCFSNLVRAGAPSPAPAMREFANEVLSALGREAVEDPFDEGLTPIEDRITAEFAGGADDVTEFCWHMPTARIYVAYGLRWSKLPNWAGAAFALTEAAHATERSAARAIAFSALDLIDRPQVLEAARAELDQRLSERRVEPLLEADTVPPEELFFPPAASLQDAGARPRDSR
jgi:aminobenzoyl-glutamate utilization protein B